MVCGPQPTHVHILTKAEFRRAVPCLLSSALIPFPVTHFSAPPLIHPSLPCVFALDLTRRCVRYGIQYGVDKPDTRFDMRLNDVSMLLQNTAVVRFPLSTHCVRCLLFPLVCTHMRALYRWHLPFITCPSALHYSCIAPLHLPFPEHITHVYTNTKHTCILSVPQNGALLAYVFLFFILCSPCFVRRLPAMEQPPSS